MSEITRMANIRGSNVPLTSKKFTRSESPEAQKSLPSEEENFYVTCRAAYLAVFKSSLESINTKEQLCLVLQQAGRNPSRQTLNKYWTSRTKELDFDDFCSILKKEKALPKAELLNAFKQIDVNNKGYILHEDLHKVLTTKGEKMTRDEVSAVVRLADINSNGRLDYNKFCKTFISTSENCLKSAKEKMASNNKWKQQQLGSHKERSPERIASPAPKQSPRTPTKSGIDFTPKKVDNKSPRPSSSRSLKASVSSIISMGANSTKDSKLTEPHNLKEWQKTQSKGCFYLEEDGEIVSHRYKLHVPQKSTVYLNIQPLNLSQEKGKPSPWISVDTALYVLKEPESQEDLQLVFFTELRNKEIFGWKGELASGVYWLIPFTTGCRLRKKKKQMKGEAKLVNRDKNGALLLTKEFRATLSDIFDMIDLDGNGLLSLEEYNFFELRTSGDKCDDDAWSLCKENFETQKNELTRQGFMDLNLMEASEHEGDPEDLWVTLQSMGYNRALELTEACPFVIDVYAEKCKPRVKAASLDSGSAHLDKAICKSVLLKGEAKVMDGYDNMVVHTYKSDTRITSVLENKSGNQVIVRVNNEQSKNCTNSRGLDVFAVEVPPKTKMVCQHVMPMNEWQEWIYNCVQSIMP
ncbi:EF-hand calcium-binding domain-containing protein 7 isoform X2 [Ambystoma mexicanum]|uniref:EF-hand calcium-binding domain-containing protein 7 isoform X2 n=1 Tax=Ambystoma mexicanum TaxID=8296 RepID=UPI0037E7764E